MAVAYPFMCGCSSMSLPCARKRCESTARVILKSAFGKAVGVLWNAYH